MTPPPIVNGIDTFLERNFIKSVFIKQLLIEASMSKIIISSEPKSDNLLIVGMGWPIFLYVLKLVLCTTQPFLIKITEHENLAKPHQWRLSFRS